MNGKEISSWEAPSETITLAEYTGQSRGFYLVQLQDSNGRIIDTDRHLIKSMVDHPHYAARP